MSSAARRAVTACWPYLVVAVLPFLLYPKLFALDPEERKIFRGDFLNQHYVWKSYALERVKQGELPLWNPHLLGGVAFHANPQVGIFYPPTYLLLPFHRDGKVDYVALEAYQLLHLAFAGAGMVLLMRLLGVGNLGALVAAAVFMFTGFFTTPGHHAIVLTASWIPWALYAVKRALDAESLGSLSFLALVLALMVLAGHPQIAYYGLALATVWAVGAGGFRRAAFRFLPAAALALGMAAIQLLPTYQLAEDSSRAAMGYEYSTSFGLSPYFLAAAFAPRGQIRLPGQDGSAPLHLYVGLGTLLLAAVGLTLSRRRWRLGFAGLAAAGLLLSLGKDSPLYDFFYTGLPGFGRFRVPYRLLGIYGLGMAGLAGLGIEVMEGAGRKSRARMRSIAKGAFAVLAVLAAWAFYLHTRLVLDPGTLAPAGVERVVGAAHWAVLLLLINCLLFVLFLWRPGERWMLGALAVVLVIDLGAFVKDRGQHPYRTLVRAGERPIQGYLRAQGYRSRYVTDSNLESYDMLHGTEFAGGHAALVDRRYSELLELGEESANAMSLLNAKFVVGGRRSSTLPWCGGRFASPLPLLDVPPEIAPAELELLPAMELRSLRFYWSPLGPGGTGIIELGGESHPLPAEAPLEIVFQEPTMVTGFRVLVEKGNPGVRLEDVEVDLNPLGLKADFVGLGPIRINLHAMPRAYFMVPSSIPSELQTIERLRCWTVHEGVQVVHPETGEGASGFFRKDAARIVTYEPERVEIETRSPRDGFLVLSDTYRPGWVAEVDGAAQSIWRAQIAMRAVPVPSGEHVVRFSYRPGALRYGAMVSLVCLIAAGGLPAYDRLRRRT